jgi:chemotaxis protein MotB
VTEELEEQAAAAASGRRQPAEEEEPAGAPEWVVTFTDMISLLVTFFVLLMTFSSMEEFELLQIQGVLPGSKGEHDLLATHRVLEAPPYDHLTNVDVDQTHSAPHSRPDEQVERAQRPGERLDSDELLVDLTSVGDGIVISWGSRYSFAPGSADLVPDLARALDRLALILSHYPHQVVVEGHADADHPATPEFPDTLSISVARALAGAERLTAGGVESTRVQVTGHAAERPRTVGATAAERRSNRRIELRLLTLSRNRAEHLAETIRERMEGLR